MKKISFWKLVEIMRSFNDKNPDKQYDPCVSGVIVYDESNYTWSYMGKERSWSYTEKERSYRVYNNNRMFQKGMIANSLRGYCLDGTDNEVRLDRYDWEKEYCYYEGEIKDDEEIEEKERN